MKIGTTSKGIYNIPNLKCFFSEESSIILLNSFTKKQVDLVVGWGNKPSSSAALKYAAKNEVQFLRLEDGFIRSLAPAKISKMPLSIVFDDKGIYYDASSPSRLENLINQNFTTEDDIKRAKLLLTSLKQNKISKYNHAPEAVESLKGLEEFVLVIDQTYNDLSVTGSLSNAETFHNMLIAAIDENPNSTILVKTHPEVVAGYKSGYLSELAQKYKCRMMAQAVNPWSLFEHASKVYTVSSQMGFEALMAGKTVRCFGMPFYAGWGLTIDEKSIGRRKAKRSLEEVFTAAYLKYPTYLNPFTLKKCEPEEIIHILSDWKAINEQNKNIKACTYISKWKQKSIIQFLESTDGKPKYYSSPKKALKNKENKIAVWASKLKEEDIVIFKKQNISLNLIEDGFLRSVGLGANLVSPQSIVVDTRGIYYDHHHPSDLEHLIQHTPFSENLLLRSKNIIQKLNELEITKYNVDTKNITLPTLPNDKVKILVVGQVENDASINLGTVDIKTNLDLLIRVRQNNPNAFIIFKPHPDCIAGQRPGLIKRETALLYADSVVEDIAITKLLNVCDEIHTLTSLTGFEALIRGKSVICYGLPFYAGWGLTHDIHTCPRRAQKVTLEELVAATVILYPRYLDPKTNLWCPAEVIIDRLKEMKQLGIKPSKLTVLRSIFGKLKRRFSK